MQTLLTLNTNPDLEEDLVDYLLSLDGVSGFTSYPVSGHGDHDDLSVSEQVSGRRKRLQVEIILDDSQVQPLLGGLAENVGKDFNWWQQPVVASGSIN
ncbi:MAG: hypothetical protein ACI934_001907 [Pseudohongiellaceae bacterium]|jgi:hypothetical protein